MPKADVSELNTLDTHKLKLKNLTPEQVRVIDDCLSSVGEYGEVDLVVQRGELRYINTLVSKACHTEERK